MPDPITPIPPDPQASVDAALGTAPMGDEAPLAFAAPTLNAMPTPPTTPEPAPATPPVMPAAPVAPEAPKLEPMPSVGSSYLPPVPPAPISAPPVEDKPKSKSKVMLVVFGIFALLGALGVGGYFAYQQFATKNTVAIVSQYQNAASCEANCDGGHALTWTTRNGVTGCYWASRACDNGGTVGSGPLKSNGPNQECYYDNNNNGTMDSADTGFGFYCGGAIDKCVSTADLNAAGGGCNAYGESIGIATVYGASCKVGSSTDTQKWVKTCSCGGVDYLFDKLGDCDHTGGGGVPDGLCAVAAKGACESGAGGTPTNPVDTWVCDANGCRITVNASGTCFVGKYTCNERKDNQSCLDNAETVAQSKSFGTNASLCGKVQQIDVTCNNAYKESRTKIFPPCDTTASTPPNPSPSPSTPASPVLACTGLTQTPATTPVIGDKITFTCAGTITPTGAAVLSYKFRYSLDGGADQLLANKTPTTAELTINACGTYSVQCKVCATIAGVLRCDPTWTGAVQ